jgi:tRNA (mo5U34)-methyltransferase
VSLLGDLDAELARAPLGAAVQAIRAALLQRIPALVHGDLPQFEAALAALPECAGAAIRLDGATVRVGRDGDLDAASTRALEAALQRLHPWRKGPFELFGVHIDSEWRSDLKWARLRGALRPLAGRAVLDVGCGNGYYAWRMLGEGARCVLGIDPTLRYLAQFQALKRYIPGAPVTLLPLRGEDLPPRLGAFDTVFSMGVLYHRREPLQHLAELRGALRAGGELVLESLVLLEPGAPTLHPERYARMRNVHAVPACETLLGWVREAGFAEVRLVDLSATTVAEQRRTAWMRFESLADFLDPGDPSRTVEGHPAPVRALVLATRAA